jgi:hypothetical protein
MQADITIWRVLLQIGLLLFLGAVAIICCPRLFPSKLSDRVGFPFWAGLFLTYFSVLRLSQIHLWVCFFIATAMLPLSAFLLVAVTVSIHKGKGKRIADVCEPGSVVDCLFVRDRSGDQP